MGLYVRNWFPAVIEGVGIPYQHHCFCCHDLVSYQLFSLMQHLRSKTFDIVFFVAFCAIIVLSALRLSELLFPARKKPCPVCSLISRIVEIDLQIN